MSIRVLDFYATWCIPCKKLDFYLKLFENKYSNVNFEKINIEKEETMHLTDKYKIKSLPTIIILDKNNNILSRIEGFDPQLILNELEKFT